MTDRQKHANASLSLPRRQFWRYLLGEVLSMRRELHGTSQHRLGEIDAVPDDVLAEMVPTWIDGHIPEIREDGLYLLKDTNHDSPKDVMQCRHSFRGHEKFMVDQFACGRNIKVISESLALASGMDEIMAFTATKTLFVRLCRCGLCRPSAAHFWNEGEQP